MASPFKERELGGKAYGIEYRNLLSYINARIINLEGNNESVCLWIVFFIIQ